MAGENWEDDADAWLEDGGSFPSSDTVSFRCPWADSAEISTAKSGRIAGSQTCENACASGEDCAIELHGNTLLCWPRDARQTCTIPRFVLGASQPPNDVRTSRASWHFVLRSGHGKGENLQLPSCLSVYVRDRFLLGPTTHPFGGGAWMASYFPCNFAHARVRPAVLGACGGSQSSLDFLLVWSLHRERFSLSLGGSFTAWPASAG